MILPAFPPLSSGSWPLNSAARDQRVTCRGGGESKEATGEARAGTRHRRRGCATHQSQPLDAADGPGAKRPARIRRKLTSTLAISVAMKIAIPTLGQHANRKAEEISDELTFSVGWALDGDG